MVASKPLTISGYEWRLKKFLKTLYEAGIHYSVRVSFFREIWDLDRIGNIRMCTALRRLYKRGILIRPTVNDKEMRGSYKWNPEYKKFS